jgi:hypothetical protein
MKVGLFWYWFLVLVPFGAVGFLSHSDVGIISFETAIECFGLLAVFYVPVIAYLRKKSLGYTLQEFLLSLIPIYGKKYDSIVEERNRKDQSGSF